MQQVNSAVSYERYRNNEVILGPTFLTLTCFVSISCLTLQTHNYHIVPELPLSQERFFSGKRCAASLTLCRAWGKIHL